MSPAAKILVVEDEKMFGSYLHELLLLNGYGMELVDNGHDALKSITKTEVDLVLLDIMLPDMDGYEVLGRIRNHHPVLPVIMMTGQASVDSAVAALKQGAYDYLEKPVEAPKLLNTINNALAQKRLQVQSEISEKKLAQSEERYHRLFENVTDALVIFNADSMQVEEINAAASNLFGYTAKEMAALKVSQLSAEEERSIRAVKEITNSKEKSQFVPLRYLLKKDGTIFPAEINQSVIVENNRVLIINVVRDITLRKKAEDELHKTRERLHHYLSASPTITYAVDPQADFACTFISQNVTTLLGYEPSDFRNDRHFWRDRIHPEDTRQQVDASALLMQKGYNNVEYRFRHCNGSYHWLRDEAKMIFDTHGRPAEIVGSMIDVTDQKRVEGQLRESEKRFRDLVENALIGIIIVQNNRIVYHNPNQTRMYESIQTRSMDKIFARLHPEDREDVKTAYDDIVSGNVQTVEKDIRFYPSGKIGSKAGLRWAKCKAASFKYYGKPAVLINVIDITDAKQLEHQLIIKNKMLSLGRVAAGIAHEIRNPLMGINSYIYTLKDCCGTENPDTEDFELMQQIVDQIQCASNKIEAVIKRVIDFSKPGLPKMVLTDINQPLEEVIELSAVTLRKNSVKLEKNLTANMPHCYVDSPMIEQVILNLITNAIKAMENGNGSKMLQVKTYSENNTLCIDISDSGPGVPLNLRDKIFDPFFTTKDDSQGIGLNISQRIVADHNGYLALDTSPLGGATFKIVLPVERRMNPR
jgi:PAS domain S-box-containing protein